MLDVHPALVDELRQIARDFLGLSEADRGVILSQLCERQWRNTVRILGGAPIECGRTQVSMADLIAEIQLADAIRITRLRASGEGQEARVTYWVRVNE